MTAEPPPKSRVAAGFTLRSADTFRHSLVTDPEAIGGHVMELDFSLLPVFQHHSLFMGLPHWAEEPLAALGLPRTLDRLRAASLFIGHVSSAHEEEWRNQAYLRAGLSDLYKVEHALALDLGGRGAVYLPTKSRNPLIHLVFRLRRLVIHVADPPLKLKKIVVRIRLGEEEHEGDGTTIVIPSIEQYLRREKLKKYYREDDISRLCRWFEENQAIYGASQVLDAGVIMYAMELAEVYGCRASRDLAEG